MRPIQSAAVPRVWTYRDRSLEKDWRFSVKLSKSGPDKSKRMVGGAVGADGGAARQAEHPGEQRRDRRRLRAVWVGRGRWYTTSLPSLSPLSLCLVLISL